MFAMVARSLRREPEASHCKEAFFLAAMHTTMLDIELPVESIERQIEQVRKLHSAR